MNLFRALPNRFRNPSLVAFILSLIYWLYLLLSTQMIIANDSLEYEYLGQLINRDGLIEYFRTGPNREPLYPLLVACSMRLAESFGFPYTKVLAFLQMLILGVSQGLLYRFLKALNVRHWISAAVILYMGISPALVNSTLSLYSEIAAYPLVLAAAMVGWRYFFTSRTNTTASALIHGLTLGLLLGVSVLIKNVFEIVGPLFALAFVFSALHALKQREPRKFRQDIVFLAGFFCLFYGIVFGYKTLNLVHNGHFSVTNRASWALYGNTSRRMEPLDSKRFFAALSYVPGEGICRSLHSEEECRFWSFRESDSRGMGKLKELTAAGLNDADLDRYFIQHSAEAIRKNPLQYALLYTLEAMKLLFWESTQIGWVQYPPWLTALFGNILFKNGLRLLLFMLTGGAIAFLLFARKKGPQGTAAILMIWFITCYLAVYAFFFILTRYALPIAPLYLLLIALTLDQLAAKTAYKSGPP